MFAGQYKPGWIPTKDNCGAEIAYTYWDGSFISSYVAGSDSWFDAWVFGTPTPDQKYMPHPQCYQYPKRVVVAYANFDSWFAARDWATTVASLNKEK